MARPPRRAPRYAPSPPLVLAVVLVACLEGRGDAAVIPSPPKATPSEVAVVGLDGPALRTFREPPRTFETGPRDEPEGRLHEGQAGALDQRAGLAAPRPEPALVDEYQLALTDHLDRRFSLDAALALLRDPERDASLELGPRLRELGVEVKEGLISSKVSSLVQSLGQDLSAIQSTHPVSATARRKVSLLQAILAALQVLSDAPGAQAQDQDKEHEQAPEEDHTGPPGQETPIKKPVFSDQYLPALVQVLSHVVDEVVILEQAATKPPNSLVTTWPLGDTSGSGGSPPETTTQAETSISANSTQTQEASSTEEPASGNEDESSTEVIQVAVVPKPVNGTFVPAQIVIAGPLQGIADLLQHVSSNLNKDPANHVSIIVEDESAKKGGVKHTAKEEENKADNSDSFFKEALIHAVEDIEKANQATINKVTKDVAEDIVKEITLEVLKQTHLMTDLRSEALEDYTEDGDSMPVIQNDVPIINEENVPMTMVMSMVPSDAPEMVMNMTSDESLDDADSESTTILPSAGVRSEATQKDDKSFDTILAGDEPIEQVIESVDFEDLRDNAFLVNGIRGKEKKSVPPSKPLLKLVKLRFALSAEAKRQNFKNIQGYSKTVMDQLVTTSLMTGREQLGTLLATVLKRDEIKSPKIKASATKTLEELEDEKSALSLKLVDVPPLKYAP